MMLHPQQERPCRRAVLSVVCILVFQLTLDHHPPMSVWGLSSTATAPLVAAAEHIVLLEAECSALDGRCQQQAQVVPVDEQVAVSEAAPEASQQQPYCGLYIAESTIPGAGLGVFTAEPKEIGDMVGNSGDVCIPYIDMYWHNGGPKIYPNPFKDYFWSGRIMGMGLETDTDDVEALCTGLDCVVNCYLALTNIDKATPVYSTGSLHRAKDPGAGAFTPYHNGTTLVTRPIPAGGELFKSYGDKWFTTRQRRFGKVPLTHDYPAAERLLRLMTELPLVGPEAAVMMNGSDNTSSSGTNSSSDDNSIWHDLYQIVVTSINQGPFESRTLNALPRTWPEARTAVAAGVDLTVLHQPAATRSLDWLQQHGRCVDHLTVGVSTLLPQAGHGAFAVRDLPIHTVIATSPLHHLPRANFMNRYNFSIVDGKWVRHVDEVVGQQLALNYCFGHGESSVLLCPYGLGVNYLNHNQTLANVRIRWAKKFSVGHEQRLVDEGSIEENLEKNNKLLLSFDYVATRDIRAGEELFLDYGDAWEKAWQKHVQSYRAEGDDTGEALYASAQFWNEKFGDMPLRTHDEQRYDPYPNHLQLRCHRHLTHQQNPNIRPPQRSQYIWRIYDYGYPCRILDRFWEEGSYWYTVQLELRDDDSDYYQDDDDLAIDASDRKKTVTWVERTDVPRTAVRFFDHPGTTDLHLPYAFRHAIHIPDDMFPPQWRNSAK